MEVWQHAELTSTNCPCGLTTFTLEISQHRIRPNVIDTRFAGVVSDEVTPVPIPNTEVKLTCADGTAREAVWESRSSPAFFLEALRFLSEGPLCAGVLQKNKNATMRDETRNGPRKPKLKFPARITLSRTN